MLCQLTKEREKEILPDIYPNTREILAKLAVQLDLVAVEKDTGSNHGSTEK